MTPVAPNPALIPPGAAGAPAPPAPPQRSVEPKGPPFAQVLREKSGALAFSGHALQRIERRGIDVGDEAIARLHSGVARAAGKGSRATVVLVDGTAFVVSVRNRTVITAVDREHMKDQVFTNIDSAVIA